MNLSSNVFPLLASAALACVCSCKSPESTASSQAEAPAKAAPPALTKPPATPPPSAADTAGGDLKARFAGPAPDGTKDSETIVATQGVVLGFPAKWTSTNVYGAETMYESAKPSPTQQGASIHCQKTKEKLDKAEVHNLVYSAMAQKEKWAEEVEGTVGADKVSAMVGRGTGEAVSGKHEPVDVFYIHTAKIAGATPVLCGASVPQSQPALLKELEAAFRGMKNSKTK